MNADHKIPWYGHLIFALMFACLFSAVPFWIIGLTLQQARIAAVVVFPIAIIAYVVALRTS
jgi:uncharacterized membrane protein